MTAQSLPLSSSDSESNPGSNSASENNGLKRLFKSKTMQLLWCVAGVVGTLIVYGVLQERIMRFPYGEGDDAEFFKHSLFIVLCNRILTCTVAVIILTVQGKSFLPVAPIYSYAAISLSNVVATGCQYEALKYVSFPLQTLAKSAKMIPVMIWGTAIMQKKYGVKDYLIALSVTGGCAIFVLYGGSVKVHKEVNSTFWGILLMIGYLGFDGFTSTFQDKLFKGYNMETFNQILYVTLCSSFISLAGLNVNIVPAIQFVLRHPKCMGDILLLSLSATTSQFFISYTIKTFGALIFATIMTTRQLLSILLSSFLYGPPLTAGQCAGTLLVFSSLYYKSLSNTAKGKKEDRKSSSSTDSVSGSMDPEKLPLVGSGVQGEETHK